MKTRFSPQDLSTKAIWQRLRELTPMLTLPAMPDGTLAQLGLDSLSSIEFLCAIHEEYHVRLTELEFQPQTRITSVCDIIADRAVLPNYQLLCT
jgi:hypothetical protein